MIVRYYNNCVSWDPRDVHVDGGLVALIAATRRVTRRTFLTHVDREDLRDLEKQLGYEAYPAQGLTMAGDPHVGYFRALHHGATVYGCKWSGIEYVFA